MGNLLLKKVIMKPMENVMHHHIFSLLRRLRMGYFFPPMKFRKVKTKGHFRMPL